ncbi:MAG: caspase family protein [Hyphomicrobiaceae bacterium]|nr:caspase family protein [Hyphomicrobiaceae bacterium]
MSHIAVLVGNSEYKNLSNLDCCRDDLVAMEGLLKATEKYDSITLIENAEADDLKVQLRAALDERSPLQEIFFYFTGHGYQHEAEFFFCASNFDTRRPNETGLSTAELHTLLRFADSDLVVKVIDACNSGTLLVKSDSGFRSQEKISFKNLVQISSCLESQNSLTGDPLSVFTEKFIRAALRKSDGAVFYSDIINTLRDEFDQNNLQTPFFVSQGTGREKFVEDASRLNQIRENFVLAETSSASSEERDQSADSRATFLDRLRTADSRVVTPSTLSRFVEGFLDDLAQRIYSGDVADCFTIEQVDHPAFEETTAKKFIIKVLSQEKRSDNFVTAEHIREWRSPTKRNAMLGGLSSSLLADELLEEIWTLNLNCDMARAQVKITLTPRYVNLQRITLVVSCAPSLDYCYIFEIVTQHMLRDFQKFDTAGLEVSRRWWKLKWSDATKSVSLQISQKLLETVAGHLIAAEKRISGSETS